MQAAVDAKIKEDAGEEIQPPKPGSVDDTIAKWIAPVSACVREWTRSSVHLACGGRKGKYRTKTEDV